MNLLEINDSNLLQKTNLTRKLTLGGVTKPYPVYRIRLDLVYYNDQNDRIATWITQYKNDEKNLDFKSLDREEYNNIIQNFIIQSNPDAIKNTKNNIKLVNQREAGVVLTDGRIIDGNRRYTCLRLLNQENNEQFQYFETVILDASAEEDKKQIKMLELAIQHGEEQRVGYNLIDLTIGAYHDIVETKLLTIQEYAESTNESISEVKKRLEIAVLINEFLEYMKVPMQYHIAREMNIYSVMNELLPILRKFDSEEEKKLLKESVFSNVMMKSFADLRKYIRNVKSMVDSGFFGVYMKQQEKINTQLNEIKKITVIKNKADIDKFVKDNSDIVEDLQLSMDKSLLQSKKEQTKSKPTQIVNKSISMLMDIDTKIIDKLSDSEKDKLKDQLSKLTSAVSLIEEEFMDNTVEDKKEVVSSRPLIAERNKNEPLVYCVDENKKITNLSFPLSFGMFKFNDVQSDEVEYMVGFLNEEFEELCPMKTIHLVNNEYTRVNFSLNSSASNLKECYLVIKAVNDKYNYVKQLIKFDVMLSFTVDFDF